MDNQQKDQSTTQQQQAGMEKNPTLNEKGTNVPDYGNVTGGSADTNVEQSRQQENSDEKRTGKQ